MVGRCLPSDSSDTLTCPLAPPLGQSFQLSNEISQHLLDGNFHIHNIHQCSCLIHFIHVITAAVV